MDRIGIYQLEFHGHCGISEAERSFGQGLSVDIELECDLNKGAHSDRLEDTIDYDHLSEKIARIGRATHVHLLETLAEKIVQTTLDDRRIKSVHLRLKKRHPPREEIRGGVVVEIRRKQP